VREAVSKVIIASLRGGNDRSNLIYKKWWDCLLRSQWQLLRQPLIIIFLSVVLNM